MNQAGGSSVIDYSLLAREVHYHLLSSLIFLLWDMVVTWKSEVKHIWSKPWSSFSKWLYLYLRYISLATQIFHQFAIPHLNGGHALTSTCFAWFIYGTLLSQLHTTALEIILAIRVYALFNRSRRIAVTIGVHMTLEYITHVIVISKYFPGIVFIPHCILVKPPYPILYQTVAALATQTTLACLALMKHILTRRSGWGRTSLVSILIGEGTAAYALECVLFFYITLCWKFRDERTVIIFFWTISVISSCGCRLIISTQRLTVNEDTHSVSRSHTTSQIDIEVPYLTTQSM